MTLLSHMDLRSYENVKLLKWEPIVEYTCICLTLLSKVNDDMLIKGEYSLNNMRVLGLFLETRPSNHVELSSHDRRLIELTIIDQNR